MTVLLAIVAKVQVLRLILPFMSGNIPDCPENGCGQRSQEQLISTMFQFMKTFKQNKIDKNRN